MPRRPAPLTSKTSDCGNGIGEYDAPLFFSFVRPAMYATNNPRRPKVVALTPKTPSNPQRSRSANTRVQLRPVSRAGTASPRRQSPLPAVNRRASVTSSPVRFKGANTRAPARPVGRAGSLSPRRPSLQPATNRRTPGTTSPVRFRGANTRAPASPVGRAGTANTPPWKFKTPVPTRPITTANIKTRVPAKPGNTRHAAIGFETSYPTPTPSLKPFWTPSWAPSPTPKASKAPARSLVPTPNPSRAPVIQTARPVRARVAQTPQAQTPQGTEGGGVPPMVPAPTPQPRNISITIKNDAENTNESEVKGGGVVGGPVLPVWPYVEEQTSSGDTEQTGQPMESTAPVTATGVDALLPGGEGNPAAEDPDSGARGGVFGMSMTTCLFVSVLIVGALAGGWYAWKRWKSSPGGGPIRGPPNMPNTPRMF